MAPSSPEKRPALVGLPLSPREPREPREPRDGGSLTPLPESSGDFDEQDLLDQATAADRNSKIAGVLIAISLLLGIATIILLLGSRATWTLDTEARYDYAQRQVEVEATVTVNRPAVLFLEGGTPAERYQLAAEVERQATFVFPFASLPLGPSGRTLVLQEEQGEAAIIARVELPLFRDYEVQEDLTTLTPPDYLLGLQFQLPAGNRLTVAGQELSGTTATARVALAELYARVDELEGTTAVYPVPVRIVRADGTTLEGQHTVTVPLPVTPLAVEQPTAALTVTAAGELLVRGRTRPGARVLVGGGAVTVDATGGFEVLVGLGEVSSFQLPEQVTAEQAQTLAQDTARKQGVELELLADLPGHVPSSKNVQFLRISPEMAVRYDGLVR